MAGPPTTPMDITMVSPSADDDKGNDRGGDRGDDRSSDRSSDRGRQQRTTATEDDDDRGGTVIEKTGFATLPRELILEIIRLCIPPYRPDLKRDVAQLSAVNKSLRIICIPTLFNIVQMRTNHRRFSRLVRAIEGSDVLSAIQHLKIISVLPSETSGNTSESWYRDTPAQFASVLGQMSNLRDLDLYFADGYQSLMVAVQYELLKQRITVPSVTKFKHFAESTAHFIPTVFTGLNALHLTIRMGKSPKTIPGLSTIASKLNLHTLSLCKFGWQGKDFDEIHDLFPGVTKVIIGGEIQKFKLSTVFPVFKRFRKLKILGLTDAFDFTIGDVMTNLLVEEGICPCDCCLGENPCTIDTNCSCDECHYNMKNYEKYHAMAQRNLSMFMEEDQVENATSLFKTCPRLETVYFQLRQDVYSTRYRPVKDETDKFDTVLIDKYQDWPTISTEL
ncbi:F-box domain-containing protein [Colletotrichum asianum]